MLQHVKQSAWCSRLRNATRRVTASSAPPPGVHSNAPRAWGSWRCSAFAAAGNAKRMQRYVR
eukprot:1787470-Pyramimonas_sp.AAC.1